MKQYILNPETTKDFLKILESLIVNKILFTIDCTEQDYKDFDEVVPQVLIKVNEHVNILEDINGSFDYFEY